MLPRGQPFPFYEVNLEYIHAIFLHCSLYRPWEGLLDFLILLHFKIAFKRASAKFPLNFALRYGKQTVHDQFGLREAKAWQVSHHANNPSDAHAVIQCSGAFTNRQQWTLGTKTTLRSKARAPLNQFSQDDTKTVLDWLYRLRFFVFTPHALMLLIVMVYQQDRFRHPSSAASHLSSEATKLSYCFYRLRSLLLVITSQSTQCPPLEPAQSTCTSCMHTHIQTHAASASII